MMTLFIRLTFLTALICLSGCTLLDNLKQKSPSKRLLYPSLQTFEFEGVLIHYKDLSNPCDDTTVTWNDLRRFPPIQKVALTETQIDCGDTKDNKSQIAATRFEVVREISIPFESRQSDLAGNANMKRFNTINEAMSTDTLFEIHGAAGTVGKKSEMLGLKRASAVKAQLIKQGVQSGQIKIMPYDPEIPGLQALVKVLTPVIL